MPRAKYRRPNNLKVGRREQMKGGSWRKGSLANSRRKFT